MSENETLVEQINDELGSRTARYRLGSVLVEHDMGGIYIDAVDGEYMVESCIAGPDDHDGVPIWEERQCDSISNFDDLIEYIDEILDNVG